MRYLAGLLLAPLLWAQAPFFPLSQVKPGMRGTGKTVFSGNRVEEFQVEILGVLENVGHRQSLVLARLSGGPLERSGVLQGMSGSPVYLEGRLLGAVSAGFALSKEPIAGIRPIGEMLDVDAAPASSPAARLELSPAPRLAFAARPPAEFPLGESRLVDIATPISFGGFTRATIDHFAPQLRSLGLEPRQGMLGGGASSGGAPQPLPPLEPGSMISVQLINGDFIVGADGTVTHIEGDRIYAFGHRFLSLGPTDMPFARAEVLTLLPNLSTSFKISAAREWRGAITTDLNAAVTGRIGLRSDLLPVSIRLKRRGAAGAPRSYSMQLVRDRFLSPFLLQMASFSALDATERLLGPATILARGTVDFASGGPPIRIENSYAGEANVPAQAALAAALPLAYVMQSGFETLRPARVELELEVVEQNRRFDIEQIWASRTVVEPGEVLELNVLMTGDSGAERLYKISYPVPVGAPPGALHFTVSDANTRNLAEFRRLLGHSPASPEEVVSFLNGLKPSSRAYIRVWRAQPTYQMRGRDLPDPPPSVAMILQRSQSSSGATAQVYDSKVAELELDGGDAVVSGTRTVQVEVKR